MFNRFELIGIAVSILAMATALWLLRVETAVLSTAASATANQASAVVVADGEGPAPLAEAIVAASEGTGSLERLIVDDVVIGTGAAVEAGDTVTVNYIGTLQNGQEFDNSYKRGEPFTFTVGEGRVIAGWEQGVVGMQVGGQRILVIPAALGYGRDGYGPIPGGATLVFAIELLSIE